MSGAAALKRTVNVVEQLLAKGYTKTEIGCLPADWEVVELGRLLEFQNGVNADKEAYGSGTPFANVLEVLTNTHLLPTMIPGSVQLTKRQQESYSVKPGDILFNRTSETQEEIGLASVYVADAPIVFGGFVIRGRPVTEQLHRHYSGWGLRAPAVRGQIIARGQGAIRANIGQADLRTVLIPLPSIAEQHAIAEALSDANTLIEVLERLIVKKRAIKQGAMQELVTGKRRLAGFKGEWHERSFGELFNFSGGLSASREQLSQSGHCYLHYGDIHTSAKNYIELDKERTSIPKLDVPIGKVNQSALLEDGDVVFVDASEDDEGTSKHLVISNPAREPFISGLHTIVAKAKTAELDKKYLRFCFQTKPVKNQFRFYAVGTKVSGISKGNVVKIALSYPSLPEQSAIAAVLFEMESELEILEAKLTKARQIKQGMMQELLTGRIRLV